MARNDDDKSAAFLACFVTLTIIATVLVGLRFWIRTQLVRKVGLDDWFALAALILMFGSLGCMGSAVHYGLGRHYDTLTSHDAVMAMKMLWVGFQITPSSEATAKISITIMLLRITPSKQWRWFFGFWIVLMILITVITLYSIMLSCHPVQLLWDPNVKGACGATARTVDIYLQGIIASLYDVVLAVSPTILLWGIQVSSRTKWLLCGLLALGFFTAVACIARTAYTYESTNTTDPTFAIMEFVTWKCVELPLSIIVGCLPTLRPMYDKSARCHSSRRSERLNDESYEIPSVNREHFHRTAEITVGYRSTSSGDETSVKKSVRDQRTPV